MIEAISAAEAAQAAAAAAVSGGSTSSSDGAPAPVRRAGLRPRGASTPAPRAAPAAPTPPATTPLEDVTADLTAALALLPDAARAELDVSVIGSIDLKDYVHLQRKLTRHIEEARADRVLSTAKAAVAAAAPGSESYTRALRNLAHLRASDGTWLLAPALAHMRLSLLSRMSTCCPA